MQVTVDTIEATAVQEATGLPSVALPTSGAPVSLKEKTGKLLTSVWNRVWPALLFLLSPLLYVGRLFITLYGIVIARTIGDAQISLRAKCPACGCRELHKIMFHRDYNKVIHGCARCGSEWGEDPIVPVTRWLIVRQEEPKNDRRV